MLVTLLVLNILLAQSDIQTTSACQQSEQLILRIFKRGGVGGISQECLLFSNGRIVLPGRESLQLERKETERLLTLAKRLPPKPYRWGKRAAADKRPPMTASHDYPLSYHVTIYEAGKESESFFPVESKDPAISEFVSALVSIQRRIKPQLKGP